MRASPHYPAFLSLSGKRVLLVGGGTIAASKALALARCGALVTAVAPQLSPAVLRSAESAVRRRFRPDDLDGAALVICATDDEKLNERVSALCRKRGIWANVVDRPRLCDFILPAVVRRGRLAIAVSTGGASPALAKHLRRKLERFLTPADVLLAETLHAMRPRLLELGPARRRRVIARLLR